MDILDKIIASKRSEVQHRRELYPVKLLERSVYFETAPVSLCRYLKRQDKIGIIAEIKRRSPSRGILNSAISVEELSVGYMQAGASALSVLTDGEYFGGSNDDLRTARRFNFCPILRKDFTIDEYQVIEAKSIGADAVLLIARILSEAQLSELTQAAHTLHLEVLVEVHDATEISAALSCGADVVGVNNRDLKTFKTDCTCSLELISRIPSDVVTVSESGISDAETILKLSAAGFDGFLIGERFMAAARPHERCARLVNEVKRLQASHSDGVGTHDS